MILDSFCLCVEYKQVRAGYCSHKQVKFKTLKDILKPLLKKFKNEHTNEIHNKRENDVLPSIRSIMCFDPGVY